MRDVTQEMIKIWSINKLGYDFMGYNFNNKKDLAFHHLIVPKRDCKEKGLGQGYLIWNGAVLNKYTSHEYLHKIELYDRDRFLYITAIMIGINKQREILYSDIKEIHECLCGFEREFSGVRNHDGNLIIKPKYEERVLKRR